MEIHNKNMNKIGNFFAKCSKTVWEFFKKYYFVIFCVIALLLPDRVLVNLPKEKMFINSKEAFVSTLFTWCWIFIITLFCICIPKKKSGRIAFSVIAVLLICLSFGQYVYYRIFEQFFWIKSIFLLPISAIITFFCGIPLGTEGPCVQMGTAIGEGISKGFNSKKQKG